MSSSDSARVHSIKPDIKKTKHFAATSRFYTVLTIFQMFKILYPKKNQAVTFWKLFCPKLKSSKVFFASIRAN